MINLMIYLIYIFERTKEYDKIAENDIEISKE